MGRPVAEIHSRFQAQVEALQEAALELSDTIASSGQRPWMLLDLADWNGDVLAIEDIAKAFDRDDINQQYAEMFRDPDNLGSLGSCVALKLQVDWLASLERALRARHATSVRCAVHAAARRKGHGNDNGIFAVGTLKYVQDVIQQGS